MEQLLIETFQPQEAKILVESTGKAVYLSGTIMQAGELNKNGRTYQLAEMAQAVTNANNHIKEFGGIFGEADHPATLQINFDRISHVITEMKMDGNNVYGKLKLLDTPMGLIAKELSKTGVRYGVSSRGTGNVRSDGVVEGFTFVTADLVITPSANAYPNTVYESLQSKLGEKVLTLAEQVQTDPAAQKYFIEKFNRFLSEIVNKK